MTIALYLPCPWSSTRRALTCLFFICTSFMRRRARFSRSRVNNRLVHRRRILQHAIVTSDLCDLVHFESRTSRFHVNSPRSTKKRILTQRQNRRKSLEIIETSRRSQQNLQVTRRHARSYRNPLVACRAGAKGLGVRLNRERSQHGPFSCFALVIQIYSLF